MKLQFRKEFAPLSIVLLVWIFQPAVHGEAALSPQVFPPEIWIVGVVYPSAPNHTHWICAMVRASEPTVELQVWIWNQQGQRVVDGEFAFYKWRYPSPYGDWYFFLYKWTPTEAGNHTMILFAYYRNSQKYPPQPDIQGPFIFTVQNLTEVPAARRFSVVEVRG